MPHSSPADPTFAVLLILAGVLACVAGWIGWALATRFAAERVRNELEAYKAEFEREIRADAIARSTSVMRGKVSEHLVPYLPEFGETFDPRDARFLGAPVDFVVFDGLSEWDECDRVVFVEVKTGRGSLSTRERRVRDAIVDGRVEWAEIRVLEQD